MKYETNDESFALNVSMFCAYPLFSYKKHLRILNGGVYRIHVSIKENYWSYFDIKTGKYSDDL